MDFTIFEQVTSGKRFPEPIAMMRHNYRSYCKINLGLEVLSRRPDGYHELNTIFYRLDSPYDEIEVESGPVYSLTVEGSDIPSDSSNLITRAVEACAQLKGMSMPALSIHLKKKVPSGAGLGGGSANAAKAIEIFSELVSPLTREEQLSVARSLGADVPFFMLGLRAAVASGIGDVLTPLEFALPNHILVVKPRSISISTADAYRILNVTGVREPIDLASAVKMPFNLWKETFKNDLEPVAFQIAPELRALKQRLYGSGAEFALMSGSGSAFFAVFASAESVSKARSLLSANRTLEVFLSPQSH